MNKFVIAAVAVLSLITGIYVFQQFIKQPQPEFALYYQTPRDVKPFAMTDHLNQTFDNERLKGKWSWVFFGYTSCPDVCPTTLQELNFYYDELKALSENTQVLFVSVDPQRDNVDKLAQYIAYFNNEFIALTADHSVLFPFARNLGLMYAISDDNQQGEYLVDHSASIVLINPQGKISAIFKPKQALGELPIISGDQLVADFDKILNLAM